MRYFLVTSWCLLFDAVVLELPFQFGSEKEFHGLFRIQILYYLVCERKNYSQPLDGIFEIY